MEIQTLQGYFHKGFFYQQGQKVSLPEHQVVIVNILNLPIDIVETKKMDGQCLNKSTAVNDEAKKEEKQARKDWINRLKQARLLAQGEPLPNFQPRQPMSEPHGLID